MKLIKRILIGLLLLVVLAVGAAFAAIQLRWKRTFEAPYPSTTASQDPAVIERGRYLVYGAAACVACHIPREQWDALNKGDTPPLSGNHLFRLPFGDLYSRNLTPDADTGIGR